jgi:hypothetical protein
MEEFFKDVFCWSPIKFDEFEAIIGILFWEVNDAKSAWS